MLPQKVSLCTIFTLYIFTFHILSQKIVFFRLSQHFQLYSLIMFPPTVTQLYLLTMFFFPTATQLYLLIMYFSTTANKQTNIWARGRLELRKPQNLTNTRQYGKTLRVKFTLTKLQEDLLEQKARDKLLMLTKILTKAAEIKYFKFQMKSARQISTPRLRKSRLN